MFTGFTNLPITGYLSFPVMSTIPPGINFIARSLLNFLLPCVVLYPTLLIGSSHLFNSDLQSWASLALSLGLRLGYYLSKPWIQELRNRRAAYASGAALPLHVQENSLEVVKELLHDLEDGYPCEFLLLMKPVGRTLTSCMSNTSFVQASPSESYLRSISLVYSDSPLE